MSAIEDALDEYQQFTQRTAVYPEALATPYLALGLGDEVGEVLEKVVALFRNNSQAKRDAVASEVGDVMWYLAQLLLRLECPLGDVWRGAQSLPTEFEASFIGAANEACIATSGLQGRIKKQLRDGSLDLAKTYQLACRLVLALQALTAYCGSNLTIVVCQNRAKLEDRLARNVIKGEGDTR
jgi:hypothetical protein